MSCGRFETYGKTKHRERRVSLSSGEIVRKVLARTTRVREFLEVHRGEQPDLEKPLTNFAPFMIHEAFPTLTETAFGGHPCCVVSVTYVRSHCFHGANEGSNPSGDAN